MRDYQFSVSSNTDIFLYEHFYFMLRYLFFFFGNICDVLCGLLVYLPHWGLGFDFQSLARLSFSHFDVPFSSIYIITRLILPTLLSCFPVYFDYSLLSKQ